MPTLPAIAVAVCIFLLLITPHAASPALYTTESDAFTAMHDRVSVLRQLSQDSTGVALPLMEEIFASSGTLVLNINLKDFESAEKDLDEYLARSRQFDNMVIRLDMSQSDLEEWRRLNAQNREDLTSLFEDTQRFSELKRLEIEYRDADNPDMLYSVMYEGEALRSRIKETVSSYEGRNEEMAGVSERFGVATDDYTQSVEDALAVSASVEDEQEERSTEIRRVVPPRADRSITIGVEPAEVRYGDILTISGRITGSGSRDVALYLDSRLLWNGTVTFDGTYLHRMRIAMIRTGMHTLYATSDGVFSDVPVFRVIQSPTSVTLSSSGGGKVSGLLLSGDIPVRNAPVRILSAGRPVATLTTDEDGRFAGPLGLPEGDHRVVAAFDDLRYPLEPSWSVEVLVHVPPRKEGQEIGAILLYPLVVLMLFAAVGGGIWYLRSRRPLPTPPASFLEERPDDTEEGLADDIETDLSPLPESDSDPVLEAYHAAAGSDYPDALRHLFISLAGAAGLQNPSYATAGDLRVALPSDTRMHAWLSAYERVLYAGQIPQDKEREWFLSEYLLLREVLA
ncbi:hypothetical protein RJ53_04750 [Methanocalculus chunghsingensis]|uniref:DUF4129 domain-containing protein n=1 Tax=Methanocalculus chunghsingensis TaxID=156457 RepID=A0A8J7WA03_9EURY|nr:hypothetical protein [Methanocalculus chunghsingensis]